MKSMVKILVTIMALSLATAPVFAAWPTGKMNKPAKVAHLVGTYGCDRSEIVKLTVSLLNALEESLSAAAVAPAPEVMDMVGGGEDLEVGGGEDVGLELGGGAGLEVVVEAGNKHGREEHEVVGGVLALAPEVGGALEVAPVPVVAEKRQRLPDLGKFCPPSVRFFTREDLARMNMAVRNTSKLRKDTANTVASIEAATDRNGRVLSGYVTKKAKADDALAANRQAVAQLAFAIKQNSLFEYFAPIAEALSALTARAADLTVAEIDGFIAMIEGIITQVTVEDGTMSIGTKAEFTTLMIPYADYATHLEAYVCELRAAVAAGKFAQSPDLVVVEQRGGYAQRVRQILFSSGALIAAATLAGAVVGYHGAPEIIVAGFVRGIISQEAFEGVQVLVISASALVGGSVARLATGGPAVVRDSSSAGEKRRHGGDDNV